MSKADNPGAAIQNEADRKIVAETEADLRERQAAWEDERQRYVGSRAQELRDDYENALNARFRDEARREHDASSAPWTFERVADLRLRQNAKEDAHRAKWVERLAAMRWPTPAAETSPLHAKPGTVLGTQGRQVRG